MILELFILIEVIIVAFCFLFFHKNKPKQISLKGRHVVITGGSMGIGFELAAEAVRQGANVSIIARDKIKLNAARAKLEEIQKSDSTLLSNASLIQTEAVDIGLDLIQTQQAVDRLVSQAGPVEILINNAGIVRSCDFSTSSSKDFDDQIRTNYLGSVYCTKAVVESMKSRQFGRVVFVSSQAGQVGIYAYTGYSASKFALKGLAEALQMELKPYNIHVTLAFPADTDTPGLKEEILDRTEESKLIAGSSGLMEPHKVAVGIINSLKKGSWNSYFGVNGFLLSILTCGAGPATTFFETLLQLLLLPFTRLIMLIFQFHFDSVMRKCFKKNSSTARTSN